VVLTKAVKNAGPEKAPSVDVSTSDAVTQFRQDLASMSYEQQVEAIRPSLPIQFNATGDASASASTSGDAPTDEERAKLLELLGNDEALLDRLLANSKINDNKAELKTLLELPKAGKVQLATLLDSAKVTTLDEVKTLAAAASKARDADHLASLIGNAKVRSAADLVVLLTSDKIPDADAFDELLLHGKVNSTEHLVILLTDAKVPSSAELKVVLDMWKLDKAETLVTLVQRFDEFKHARWNLCSAFDLFLDPEMADLARAMGEAQQYSVQLTLDPIRARISLDALRDVENRVNAELAVWSPADLIGMTVRIFQEFLAYRNHWEPAIDAALQKARDFVTERAGAGPTSIDFAVVSTELHEADARAGATKKPLIAQAKIDIAGSDSATLANQSAQPATASGDGSYAAPGGEQGLYVDEQGQTEMAALDSGEDRPSPEEIDAYISRNDVLQQGLADCFLQAALSSVAATHPSVIYNSITAHSETSYTIRLYRRTPYAAPGQPVGFEACMVAIDSSLPTDGGVARMNAEVRKKASLWEYVRVWRPPQVQELWAVLIEKAVAKLWGTGFAGLNQGGMAANAFEALTGTAASSVGLPAGSNDFQKDQKWTEIVDHITNNRPLAAGTDYRRIFKECLAQDKVKPILQALLGSNKDALVTAVPNVEALLAGNDIGALQTALCTVYEKGTKPIKDALVRDHIIPETGAAPWHVYSIFSATEVPGAGAPANPPSRSLLMRNPWGSVIPLCSSLATGPEADGGAFDISFDDFLTIFSSLHIGMVNVGP